MSHANQLQQDGTEILVGTGSEVSRRLHRSTARRALAVTFADDKQSAVLEKLVRESRVSSAHCRATSAEDAGRDRWSSFAGDHDSGRRTGPGTDDGGRQIDDLAKR